ncbi:MAG: bifunctional riboflavin kinase/FAD synthetase [Pseudomonadota bacterium]
MVAAPVPLHGLPDALTGGTVAIGNFDGMHAGHRAVLSEALLGPGPVVALTFEPHPRAYFSGVPIFRLTPPAQKAAIAEALGLDGLVVVPFDEALAGMAPAAFIDDILGRTLKAKRLVVGHDFRFGAKRAGDAAALKADGRFDVTVVAAHADGAGAVSSSRIRTALSDGAPEVAANLLGYRYQVRAPIIHGEKRGRTLNYPTANQALPAESRLAHGVYAVRIHAAGAWRDGVASFGRRPMFDDGAPLLETFIFDFAGDLYGQAVTVAFVAFLRPEMTFDDLPALIEQMDADSARARTVLSEAKPLSPLDQALNF